MVRLITHNLLTCAVKGCVGSGRNFPLQFKNVQLEIREAEFNPAFLRNFFNKLDWPALISSLRELGDTSLPDTRPELSADENEAQEEFLKLLHRALLELSVKEGEMVCQNCGHVYPIRDGIPNMLLAAHEV